MTKPRTRRKQKYTDAGYLFLLELLQPEGMAVIARALTWRRVIWTQPGTDRAEKALIKAIDRLLRARAKRRADGK